MLALRSLAALALCAFVMVESANGAALCTAEETERLEAIVEPIKGLLTTCKADTGFAMYPFKSFPTAQQKRFVCNGRSCPAVVVQLQDAKVPACGVTIDGQTMTIPQYLKSMCTYE